MKERCGTAEQGGSSSKPQKSATSDTLICWIVVEAIGTHESSSGVGGLFAVCAQT
jgi:hypothetical protein